MRVLNVPDVVARKARAVGADEWLVHLPEIVADLETAWELTAGRPYRDATEAFVCEAKLNDDTPVVLKISIPRDGGALRHEATVLALSEGEGCATLLRTDEAVGALLLERLGSTLHSLGYPIARRLEILCATSERLWRRAPECGLPTGSEKALWLVDFITTTWEELDRPCVLRTVEHALACAQRRVGAFDEEVAAVVHGDVHEWNELVADDGFKLIDPDGLLTEAEYDLGGLMREDPLELLRGHPFDRARWLAQRCNLDAGAIWEWGVIERVSTGLLARKVGLQPVGDQMLMVADHISLHFNFLPLVF